MSNDEPVYDTAEMLGIAEHVARDLAKGHFDLERLTVVEYHYIQTLVGQARARLRRKHDLETLDLALQLAHEAGDQLRAKLDEAAS